MKGILSKMSGKAGGFTRRGLLAKGPGILAGVCVLSAGGLALLKKGEAEGGQTKDFLCGNSTTEFTNLPWTYKKLSPAEIKEVGERAHDNWFKGFCAYATLSGVIEVLREKVGGQYKTFPIEVINFAHGGTAGWGGTCGTLIGAGMAASLAAGTKAGEEIANEVMNYYSETELPTFIPGHPKAEIKAKSISHTPLCHISVGKWMKAEGIAEGKGPEGVGFLSAQQMERCARMSANMAIKTVEFLNDWSEGKFEAVHTSPTLENHITSQFNCTDCHGEKVPSPGPFGTGVDILKGA